MIKNISWGQSEKGFGIAGVSSPTAHYTETGCQEILSPSSLPGMGQTPGGCNNSLLFHSLWITKTLFLSAFFYAQFYPVATK